jgi:hypothetical protein
MFSTAVQGMIFIWVTLCMSRQEMVRRCGRSEYLIALLLSSMFQTQTPTMSTDCSSIILTGDTDWLPSVLKKLVAIN